MTARTKSRVLIVDDSAIVRKLLADALGSEPDMEVVGGAADPFIARDLILQHKPDVVTLDIEMPRMDGLTFLRKLMAHHPLPVIIISSLTQLGSAASVEALRSGAVDLIAKPDGPYSVGQVAQRLKARIRAIRVSNLTFQGPRRTAAFAPPGAASPVPASGRSLRGLVLIGASTGGTQAIEAVLSRLPGDMPPILIAQHMPPAFTRAFAERLDSCCPTRVVEAAGGEVLERGSAYVAPGDHHLLVERQGLRLHTLVTRGPLVHHQRPAVDVLFQSAATLVGLPIVALLLTGMGADGADGMVALRKAGAMTLAEDEQSCVVFGMPKEAIARGGAVRVVSLLDMPAAIFDGFRELAAGACLAPQAPAVSADC